MIKTKFHTAESIAKNTWRISESGMVNCYLLTGDTGALLIDTGCGLGDLSEVVKRITGLSVTVVLTHMHPDHAGGVSHFGAYSVMKEDFAFTYSFLSMPAFSRIMITDAKVKNPKMPKLFYNAKRNVLHDGQVFNLGNREIRVMAVSGHTKGSAAFVDEANKLIFTGDDANVSLWMHLPGCTGMKTWKSGARKILDLLNDGYTGWDGHSPKAQTKEQVQETWDLAEKLIKEAEDGTLDKKSSCIPSEDVFPQIRYQRDRILK